MAVAARVGMVVVPIGMIIAGIVSRSIGPAVFGGAWLPISLWAVVIKPLRNRQSTRRTE